MGMGPLLTFSCSPRHYPALKTLEHLEHTFLPQVSHYRFCKVMVDNIPRLREEIKELSMSDLKDFLESIRKHSDKIGETAMKQVGFVGWDHPFFGKRLEVRSCGSSAFPARGSGLSLEFCYWVRSGWFSVVAPGVSSWFLDRWEVMIHCVVGFSQLEFSVVPWQSQGAAGGWNFP